MIKLLRTNSSNTDFIELVKALDADLRKRDGEDHAFYAQYNKIDLIKHVVVAYEKDLPVGCGAIKEYSNNTMEVKRMFVPAQKRGKGIAGLVLAELEKWAKELQASSCILETGIRQPEAISLYKKCGYNPISNYGQYENIEDSRCFEKKL